MSARPSWWSGRGAWWTTEIPEGREDLLAFLGGQSGRSSRVGEDLTDVDAQRIVEHDDAGVREWVVDRWVRQGRCEDLCGCVSPCDREGRRPVEPGSRARRCGAGGGQRDRARRSPAHPGYHGFRHGGGRPRARAQVAGARLGRLPVRPGDPGLSRGRAGVVAGQHGDPLPRRARPAGHVNGERRQPAGRLRRLAAGLFRGEPAGRGWRRAGRRGERRLRDPPRQRPVGRPRGSRGRRRPTTCSATSPPRRGGPASGR